MLVPVLFVNPKGKHIRIERNPKAFNNTSRVFKHDGGLNCDHVKRLGIKEHFTHTNKELRF